MRESLDPPMDGGSRPRRCRRLRSRAKGDGRFSSAAETSCVLSAVKFPTDTMHSASRMPLRVGCFFESAGCCSLHLDDGCAAPSGCGDGLAVHCFEAAATPARSVIKNNARPVIKNNARPVIKNNARPVIKNNARGQCTQWEVGNGRYSSDSCPLRQWCIPLAKEAASPQQLREWQNRDNDTIYSLELHRSTKLGPLFVHRCLFDPMDHYSTR